MALWTTISNALVAVGAKPFATTIQALRDNPIAMGEAAAGAPIVVAGWHPYNAAVIGDSNTGLIYDSAVNGSVASITTPTFADGFEYMLAIDAVTLGNGNSLRMLVNRSSSGNTATWNISTGTTAGQVTCTGRVVFPMVRATLRAHIIESALFPHTTSNADGGLGFGSDVVSRGIAYATAQKINSATFSNSGGNITAGKMWLFKRALPNAA